METSEKTRSFRAGMNRIAQATGHDKRRGAPPPGRKSEGRVEDYNRGMESTTNRRVYRFRLEPTSEQEQGFSQFAGARRWLWNWALEQRQQFYQQTGTTISRKELSARLTALKRQPDTAWLREIDSQLLQQVLIDLHRAFVNFFEKRTRYPRFKSRKRDTARFRIPQRVQVIQGKVLIPKIGRVRARLCQPVEGLPKSATFKRDACGHWHMSLVTERENACRGTVRPPTGARPNEARIPRL
jgi:transposase